jgi:hypothetical protein
MSRVLVAIAEPSDDHMDVHDSEKITTFSLRPIMRQGTASSVPETWNRYATAAGAREAVKRMYHDDRVLRVFIVTDTAPPRFVEWVER